jgi:hypothetical protein
LRLLDDAIEVDRTPVGSDARIGCRIVQYLRDGVGQVVDGHARQNATQRTIRHFELAPYESHREASGAVGFEQLFVQRVERHGKMAQVRMWYAVWQWRQQLGNQQTV